MNKVVIHRPALTDYQRAILDSPARFTICEASTKSGKTHSHLWWGIEQWHRKDAPDTWEVWWVAPVYQQAKIAFMRLRANFGRVPGYTFNDSELACKNPQGRVFRFKSAEKPDNLYGENVLAFVFDEFTRARPEAWPALRSTVTFTGGKGKMIGNFIGNANWGHQLMEAHRGDPDFAYFKITAMQAVDAGILPGEEVEQARRSLPKAVFLALYMAEGSAHPLQLIRADAIADLWTNNHVPEGKPSIVCDVARKGRDRTVIGVFSGRRLKHVEAHGETLVNDLVEMLKTLATRYSVPRSRIVIDEGGVGGGAVDYMKGCIAFDGASPARKVKGDLNYANLRAQCYYRLADAINDAGYYMEVDDYRDDFALELEVVRRFEDMAEGKLKVIKKDEMKELIGKSPDFADLLMMHQLLELTPSTDTFERAIDHKLKGIRKEGYDRWVDGQFGYLKA